MAPCLQVHLPRFHPNVEAYARLVMSAPPAYDTRILIG